MSQFYLASGGGGGGGNKDFHVARYIVSAGGNTDGANYTTIASAYAAAVAAGAPQTVFIQPGTYTENITLSSGINLAAFDSDAQTPNVTILGKLTATFAGSVSISGIKLKTNSDFCLALTGSSATVINLVSCFINANNNTAISFTSSSPSAIINLLDCTGNVDTTGIAYFTYSGSGIGGMTFTGGYFRNDGVSTTASTVSGGGQVSFYNTFFAGPITTSNISTLTVLNSQIYSPIIVGGTGINQIFNSYITGGTSSAISVGAGATLKLFEASVDSTNTNVITGAGTLNYGGVSFTNTSSTINTTTQIPEPFPIQQGGTGDSSFTAYSVICGGTTSTGALQNVSGVGTSGQVLTSNGAAALPTWQPAGGGSTVVAFYAFLSANQANVTGNNTQYLIPFDMTSYDTNSAFNTGTGTYTIPVTGIYHLSFQVLLFGGSAASTLTLAWASINGAAFPGFRLQDFNSAPSLGTNGEFLVSNSWDYNATAGDTITMNVDVIGGVANDVGVGGGATVLVSETFFSGYKVN